MTRPKPPGAVPHQGRCRKERSFLRRPGRWGAATETQRSTLKSPYILIGADSYSSMLCRAGARADQSARVRLRLGPRPKALQGRPKPPASACCEQPGPPRTSAHVADGGQHDGRVKIAHIAYCPAEAKASGVLAGGPGVGQESQDPASTQCRRRLYPHRPRGRRPTPQQHRPGWEPPRRAPHAARRKWRGSGLGGQGGRRCRSRRRVQGRQRPWNSAGLPGCPAERALGSCPARRACRSRRLECSSWSGVFKLVREERQLSVVRRRYGRQHRRRRPRPPAGGQNDSADRGGGGGGLAARRSRRQGLCRRRWPATVSMRRPASRRISRRSLAAVTCAASAAGEDSDASPPPMPPSPGPPAMQPPLFASEEVFTVPHRIANTRRSPSGLTPIGSGVEAFNWPCAGGWSRSPVPGAAALSSI